MQVLLELPRGKPGYFYFVLWKLLAVFGFWSHSLAMLGQDDLVLLSLCSLSWLFILSFVDTCNDPESM